MLYFEVLEWIGVGKESRGIPAQNTFFLTVMAIQADVVDPFAFLFCALRVENFAAFLDHADRLAGKRAVQIDLLRFAGSRCHKEKYMK